MDYESFHEALKYHLRKRGHGAQALLCRHTDIPRSYLSRIVTGGRRAGAKVQRKIAHFFGMGLEEFVEFGRRLALGENPEAAHDLMQGMDEEQLLERLTAAVRKEMAITRQLDRAQLLYESIVENSRQLILRFDARGRISFANRGAARLLEREREELMDREWLRLMEDKFQREQASRIQNLGDQGGTLAQEVRTREDYGGRWLHLTVTLFPRQGGEEDLGQVVGFDITDNKKLLDRLIFIQHGVEMSAVPTLWVADDASIVYANRALCRLLGYSRGELENLHVWDINTMIHKESWAEKWAWFEAEENVVFDGLYRTKTGKAIPVEFRVSNLKYPDGRRYNVVFVKTKEIEGL